MKSPDVYKLITDCSGFTLLETLIYIALLSFFLSSLLGITYQSLQSVEKIYQRISLEQETNFLIRKMDWALTGASNVVVVSATQIRIARYSAPTSIDVQYNASEKTLKIFPSDQNRFYALNSSNVTLDSAVFTIGIQGTAKFVDISLVLNGQTFEFKKYLK